eukprot:TRINITY_DN6552_c0_g1_i1.p1 TRINITY_DN6552_c0_g1~~TRINITY_DN6552_c0_g1_i1.p1  ORF type:complete len:127 (-),score=39.15 TRINITY_DN6552_c0_g1_i1:72-431(-)
MEDIVARKNDASSEHARPQVAVQHPAQVVANNIRMAKESEMRMSFKVLGPGFEVCTRMNQEILSHFRRLPGLESSFVGLETVLDQDEDIDVEDFLGDVGDQPRGPQVGIHQAMESLLSM